MSAASAGTLSYGHVLESALARLQALLKGEYGLSRRAIALLLLQGDADIERRVRQAEGDRYPSIEQFLAEVRHGYGRPLREVIALRRQQEAQHIVATVVTAGRATRRGFAEVLSRTMMHPLLGLPILAAVLYLGLYQFVGVFAAGTGVDFIEGTVFGEWINPAFSAFFTAVIPWKVLQDLFVGEYGVLTLGLTYAVAIVLPIVSAFFIVFSMIEDSGYLPRLAMLVDRLFKGIGLSGRAVIPMVLGFGCDTMATIVTRTQETRRERVITTLLLALAIPCSAQLGVIFGILSGHPAAVGIWVGVVALVFLLVGFLASKVIPGSRASFYMEVPPLRLPRPGNVLIKTFSRMRWYFAEVLPIFLLASVLIWLGQLTGIFGLAISVIKPLVGAIGLPGEAAPAFLFGFFRRDFGAAGLFDLHASGAISGVPLLVAAVTLTLFVPCVAQFSVMMKERGLKTALAIALFIFPFAFLVGFLVNLMLRATGVSL